MLMDGPGHRFTFPRRRAWNKHVTNKPEESLLVKHRGVL